MVEGGKEMERNPVIVINFCVISLLVLGSLTTVVGYQTVQSSNQKQIQDKVHPRELVFQTILDIANTKEIQRLMLQNEISRGGFQNPEVSLLMSNPHVFTMNQLNQLYFLGVMLSRTIQKSTIYSILHRYQVNYPGIEKEISTVIEKNDNLHTQIKKISDFPCDCNESTLQGTTIAINDESTFKYRPVVCALLILLLAPLVFLYIPAEIMLFMFNYNPLLTPIAMVIYAFTIPLISIILEVGYGFKCWKIN
jgi:hypothetical protein